MASADSIANRIMQAAQAAAAAPTTEEMFPNIVRATREQFRPNTGSRNDITSTPCRRGRKKKNSYSKRVLVIRLSRADFLPPIYEQKYLKKRGLGSLARLLVIKRHWRMERIKEAVLTLVDPHVRNLLQISDFSIATSNRQKLLKKIDARLEPPDIEKALGTGMVVVIPKRDLPSDLPIILPPEPENNGQKDDPISPDSEFENDGVPQASMAVSAFTSTPQPSRTTVPAFTSLPHTITSLRESRQQSHVGSNANDVTDSIDDMDMEEPQSGDETLPSEWFIQFPELPSDAEVFDITISRGNCVHQLMKYYEDEEILRKQLNVTFEGEMGVDGGGLTKELFCTFFDKCNGLFFRGEDSLIPFLELNNMHNIDKFIIIGRILQHMLTLTKALPPKLSRICLMLIASPENQIDEDVLLAELTLHVNPYLRKVLKKAIKNFAETSRKELDIIQDFYQCNKYYSRPSGEIRRQLAVIATEIFVDTPKRIIAKMREGTAPEKFPNFWNKCDFGVLSQMQTPTATKIVNCIVTSSDLTNDESAILHYLTMYIHCLDHDKMLTLLLLIVILVSASSLTLPLFRASTCVYY